MIQGKYAKVQIIFKKQLINKLFKKKTQAAQRRKNVIGIYIYIYIYMHTKILYLTSSWETGNQNNNEILCRSDWQNSFVNSDIK